MPAIPASFQNLGRVLFPRDGITKGGLLDYYRRVAPVLLPHLHDRMFVFRRAPEGIDGPSFFVKDLPPFAPDWVPRADVPAETRRGAAKQTVTYALVNDLPTLLWVVSIGAIDLHVSLSRVPAYRCPDAVLLDLDPTPGVGFAAVVETAHHVREALDGLGLRSYPKTSGREGLHVVVPIESGPEYEETRRFARLVAQAVERAYPGLATSVFAESRRHGVMIDWRQNGVGMSMASAYSVRPVDGAPVSCPLAWDEVDEQLDPHALTTDVVLGRVERLGDLFAPVLAGGQRLPRAGAGSAQATAGRPERR